MPYATSHYYHEDGTVNWPALKREHPRARARSIKYPSGHTLRIAFWQDGGTSRSGVISLLHPVAEHLHRNPCQYADNPRFLVYETAMPDDPAIWRSRGKHLITGFALKKGERAGTAIRKIRQATLRYTSVEAKNVRTAIARQKKVWKNPIYQTVSRFAMNTYSDLVRKATLQYRKDGNEEKLRNALIAAMKWLESHYEKNPIVKHDDGYYADLPRQFSLRGSEWWLGPFKTQREATIYAGFIRGARTELHNAEDGYRVRVYGGIRLRGGPTLGPFKRPQDAAYALGSLSKSQPQARTSTDIDIVTPTRTPGQQLHVVEDPEVEDAISAMQNLGTPRREARDRVLAVVQDRGALPADEILREAFKRNPLVGASYEEYLKEFFKGQAKETPKPRKPRAPTLKVTADDLNLSDRARYVMNVEMDTTQPFKPAFANQITALEELRSHGLIKQSKGAYFLTRKGLDMRRRKVLVL